MVGSNPALEALDKIISGHDESIEKNADSNSHIESIINGIKTCAPLYAAVLNTESLEIEKDINEMLFQSKKLISDVHKKLKNKGIQITVEETAAINAFCIRVISENWKKSQEIYDEWVNPITQSLLQVGICAEYRSSDLNTQIGHEIIATIIAAGEILNALNSGTRVTFNESDYSTCIKTLNEAVNQAIEKLTQFHIPYEDADQVRHHLTKQSGEIFVSIIHNELDFFKESERQKMVSGGSEKIVFSIGDVCRKFQCRMNTFVTAIFVNSRIAS